MQLEPKQSKPIRNVLRTAAIALLAVPAVARADQEPANQIDVTNLFYGEQGRTSVVEPIVRFSRLFQNGQSISAQLGIDVITGASPTGQVPSGTVQTRTSASGRTITSAAGALPTAPFRDRRISFDPEWKAPVGRFVTTDVSGHVSREKDYQSLGFNGSASIDMFQRLVTLTVGGGMSRDSVFPVGGTPGGLTTGDIIFTGKNPKDVNNIVLGVSRILTRRWMVAVNGTRTMESGYLTEPYKLVSVINANGTPVSALTDKRPSTRDRTSIMLSSVYHLREDVMYASYRYYWDSWAIKSHTLEFRYRHDFSEQTWGEPLARFYTQSAASFYTGALIQGRPLPDFATSDYRLGALHTFTLGATLGYHPEDSPGTWTVRAQFMQQAGNSSPPNAIGIQRRFDLSPNIGIYAVVVGYSFGY